MALRELLTARVVLAVCIAVYYWCWAWNGWANYFVSIQNCVAIFAVLFFCFLSARERKYKKEIVDEMAAANLKRCDSICYKVTTALMIIAALNGPVSSKASWPSWWARGGRPSFIWKTENTIHP